MTANQAKVDASPQRDHERVGIIFVHGIGEQRRFEHLDGQVRPLIQAICRSAAANPNAKMTVEIVGGGTSTLHADQDTWNAQPQGPVRAVVHDGSGRDLHLHFHEVWWADVNEPYSLAKQIRFWLWGLAVWLYPNRHRPLPGLAVMQPPTFPWGGGALRGGMVRMKLLGVSNVFLMAAISIGAAVFFAKRLFGFSAPDFVRVLVNYLGAVKLYNQSKRFDGGFLDAFGEPPRVSIRRRMIRTITDVATQDYDRWYIFAHSLGAVVAYNGLMENSQAAANYLDEARWSGLVAAHLGGPADVPRHHVGATAGMMPARPLWLQPNDVIYRDLVLAKFRGLLTYGAPLDKFAAIWPTRVPINVGEAFFPNEAEWINVFDPTDPVAGDLKAFSGAGAGPALPASVLKPKNLGYRAHWLLLLSHLWYLRADDPRPGQLADIAARWVLSGMPFQVPLVGGPWFSSDSGTGRARRMWARVMWLIVYLALAVLAALALPLWNGVIAGAGTGIGKLLSLWTTTFQ